jgi:hypothetical protein
MVVHYENTRVTIDASHMDELISLPLSFANFRSGGKSTLSKLFKNSQSRYTGDETVIGD